MLPNLNGKQIGHLLGFMARGGSPAAALTYVTNPIHKKEPWYISPEIAPSPATLYLVTKGCMAIKRDKIKRQGNRHG